MEQACWLLDMTSYPFNIFLVHCAPGPTTIPQDIRGYYLHSGHDNLTEMGVKQEVKSLSGQPCKCSKFINNVTRVISVLRKSENSWCGMRCFDWPCLQNGSCRHVWLIKSMWLMFQSILHAILLTEWHQQQFSSHKIHTPSWVSISWC